MFYPPIKHFSYWLPFPLGYFISNNNIMQITLFPCQIVLEKWSKMSWKSWKCPGIPVGKKSGHPAPVLITFTQNVSIWTDIYIICLLCFSVYIWYFSLMPPPAITSSSLDFTSILPLLLSAQHVSLVPSSTCVMLHIRIVFPE